MKTVKNLRNALTVTAVMIATWAPLGAQAESGRTLTQLLVEKGVITELEAAGVTAAPSGELVDLLVAKGVLSQSEADSLSRAAPATEADTPAATPAGSGEFAVKAKEKSVESLTISGRIHGQWDLLSTDYDSAADPNTENNLFLRRVYLGASARFAENLSGSINANFANDAEGTAELEKAMIEYGFSENHALAFGYQKVPMGYEEITSSSKIAAVERSVGTRYFTEDLDLGARHVGLFLNGSYDSGAYFDLALTKPGQGSISNSSATDKIALWGRVGWKGDIGMGTLDAGLGAAHIPETLSAGANDRVWDIYANFNSGNFNLLAEILGGNLGNAGQNGGDARPIAYTLIPSLKLNRQLELVARFSHLDADSGIGADISNVFRRAPENGGARYDDVTAYYFGGNWLIRGNTLKLSAGYEWAQFEDNLTASQGDADVSGFRTRLQMLF